MVPISYYLILSGVLFAIGALGVMVRRNLIVIFMCVEMMLNAVNLTFVALSRELLSLDGQVIVLLVMAVAAAEVAVGLALALALYRKKKTIDVLREKGIDGIISFRTILAELVSRVAANKNYEKSDLLQVIRLLKNYDFLKSDQLELFGKRKRRAPSKKE